MADNRRYDAWKLTSTHKWCNVCKQMVPHENFATSNKTRSGLSGWCNTCQKVKYEEKKRRQEAKEQGRVVCRKRSCQTVLSRYNKGDLCSVHERLGNMI